MVLGIWIGGRSEDTWIRSNLNSKNYSERIVSGVIISCETLWTNARLHMARLQSRVDILYSFKAMVARWLRYRTCDQSRQVLNPLLIRV